MCAVEVAADMEAKLVAVTTTFVAKTPPLGMTTKGCGPPHQRRRSYACALHTVRCHCLLHVARRRAQPDQQIYSSILHFNTQQMHHPSRPPPTHTPHTSPLDAPLSHPGVAATASRFFVSMRKSFSPPSAPRRKNTEVPVCRTIFNCPPTLLTSLSAQRAAMYSTPEERHAFNTSRVSSSRYLDSRPTIEQISMGLHVSRTPHLRPLPNPLQRYPIPSPPPRLNPSLPRVSSDHHDTSTSSSQYRTRHSLPPPPSRSSMKKTSLSSSTLTQSQQPFLSSGVSPSTSMVTSGNPLTQGPSRSLSSLRARMSKFIPGYRPLSFPSSLGRTSSFTSSASDSTRPATPRKAVRFSTSVLAIDEQSS